jgi:predicted ATPase
MAGGTILRGWALVAQGQEEGISQMQQGLAAYRATGSELFRPLWLARLAEAHGQVGRADEGLRALDEALAAAHATGERFWEAELHRLQKDLVDLSRAYATGRSLAEPRRDPQWYHIFGGHRSIPAGQVFAELSALWESWR